MATWSALPEDLVDRIVALTEPFALANLALLNAACARSATSRLQKMAWLRGPPYHLPGSKIIGRQESLGWNRGRQEPYALIVHQHFDNYVLGNAEVEKLADACANGALSQCRALVLSCMRIGDSGLGIMMRGIRRGAFPQLVQLALAMCQIGDEGAAAISSACGRLKKLRTLRLEGNRIGDAGAIALAGGNLPQLTSLYLQRLESGDNPIGDEGATALATAIANGNLADVRELHVPAPILGQQLLQRTCLARGVVLCGS